LNWDAFVLTDDPDWKPAVADGPTTPGGKHLLVVQAETHLDPPGAVNRRVVYGFDNWSDDRVAESDRNLSGRPAPG
jgi:hypothetical protein